MVMSPLNINRYCCLTVICYTKFQLLPLATFATLKYALYFLQIQPKVYKTDLSLKIHRKLFDIS